MQEAAVNLPQRLALAPRWLLALSTGSVLFVTALYLADPRQHDLKLAEVRALAMARQTAGLVGSTFSVVLPIAGDLSGSGEGQP